MAKIRNMNILLGILMLSSSFTGCQMLFEQAVQDMPLTVMTNRTEGVAPLSVSFDLTQTEYVDDDILMLSEYMWDFGDDSDPYNVGKGYAPSHVYREPGTYTATVTAYLDDTEVTKSVKITVSEFSGTTYYISADGSDSNDGLSEDTPFATPAYAFNNFLGQNVRFLLRQGDTFSQDSGIILGTHGGDVLYGPVIVSSYEDSSNPSDVKPIIYDTRTDAAYGSILAMLNVNDYRFINIKLQGAGGDVTTRNTSENYPSGFVQSAVTPSVNTLFLDCDVQGAGSISFHIEGDFNVVQDSTVRDGGSYGVFVTEGINSAFIGMSMKEFANDSPEYTMRLSTHIVKNYVAYNDLWGDYTKCTFQIRGDDSSYNYVWNNQMDRFAGINQTNNEEDETLHHNTFDSNIVVMRDYEGNTYGSYDQTGIFVSSNKTMVRNNITYGFDNAYGINAHDIVGGSKTVWFYNNTGIGTRENSNFLSMRVESEDIELKNNVYYNSSSNLSSGDRFISITSIDPDYDTDISQITSDYNIFFSEGWNTESSQVIVGVAYYAPDPTLGIWQSDFNNGVHSQFADALLNLNIDTDDVTTSLANGFATIYTGSPASNAGFPDRQYTKFDFLGNERNTFMLGAISK